MQKFVALFSIPAETMQKWVESTDETDRKEQSEKLMSDWKTWTDAHSVSIVDQGLPLGKTKRVTKDEVADARNDLNYMMIVQAETPEEAAAIFKDNPHLKEIPDSYVDVMGTAGMGGM